jgi:uncharacterized membrane protein YhaH (DUF805 family)
VRKAHFFLPFRGYFHARGRISRLQYLIFSLGYLALYFGILYYPLQSEPGRTFFDDYGAAAYCGYAFIYLFWLYLSYCLNAKRLHDISWPGMLWLIALIDLPISMGSEFAAYFTEVPDGLLELGKVLETISLFTSMILGLWIVFKRGDRGPNKYGPDPLRPPEPDTSVF